MPTDQEPPALEAAAHADTFPHAGLLSHFRGPYADGPPADALIINAPPLDQFGLTELTRMAVVYVTLIVGVVMALATWVVRRRGRTAGEGAAEGLVSSFERLGPTFVKLGQLIASSPGLFPAFLSNACMRCLDEVPPFPGAVAERLIDEDLGRPPAVIFKSFDPEPLSAASIAQVHACVLPDGRPAVVKLQRPNISRQMNTDLRILYRLARLIQRLPFGRNANPVGVITDLHKVTNQELNAALEAYRQARFRDNIGVFGDNKWITAPEIYWDYCGPHTICMERMEGIPLDEFDELRRRGVDGELLLRRGVKVWNEAVLLHGPFHGDVHAGNLWALDDGRAAYLDFGIMGELSPEWREAAKDMFRTPLDADYTKLAGVYRRMKIIGDGVGTDEEVGMRLRMVMEPLLNSTLQDISLGQMLKTNLELAKQFGAQVPAEFVLIAKQMLYFERYSKELAPNYVIAKDLYLFRNIYPDLVARKVAEEAIQLPD
jgi:predicted unusual protein kinase regulating ubiquinone biosynthesis (AarF/ABC1/UbiB family)